MSIKDLFNNYKSNQFKPTESELSASKLVESSEFIENKFVEKFRYEPPIDFTTASNFAKFGSAELYYEYAFKRIYQQYPYDGSLAEQQEFHNNSTFLDKYIFENVYPRTTGHIIFSSEGTTLTTTGSSGTGQYGLPSDVQYISVHGGPHTASSGMEGKELTNTFDNSMIYDESKDRVGSFEWNPTSGSTVEFWMKKRDWFPSGNDKEVILDIWNGEASNSSSYGRITLELYKQATGPIRLTMMSGTDGFNFVDICPTTFTSASVQDNTWHHYAVSMQNVGTNTEINLYQDGTYLHTTTNASQIQSIKNVAGGVNAYIGALQTAASGTTSAAGWGKLSASVDEFRYWKKKRTTNEIGEFWFMNMGGGTNKREYNTDLGVYFKFNEGITGNSTIDQSILDYSGRISNGIMVGYTASARSTESALETLTNVEEYKDPIIYSSHPTVSSSLATYKTTGSLQDYENTSLLYHLFPSWIAEEDHENGQQLRYLTQIMASYFDTLNAQISGITEFKNKRYFSGSAKPNTYSREVLRGQGFVIPDIFIEADILEEMRGKDDNETYDKDIQKVKNLIYQNIYNNLNYIYKSKGTEKSFRNLFRCFGVDSELLKLNLYADDSTYMYKDNYEFTSIAKPVLNLNIEAHLEATVYQSGSNGLTYLSSSEGNDEEYTAMTMECEAIFPYKFEQYETGYFPTTFKTGSIAGFHRALTSSAASLTWHGTDTSLRMYAIKPDVNSRHVKFKLSGSSAGTAINLESSQFSDVYDNNKWILAARVKHEDYPFAGNITGSISGGYIVEFYGVNSVANDVKNEFSVTQSVTNAEGKALLGHAKRLYAGAHRENYTGTTLEKSDVKVSQVRFWQSHLSDAEIKEHSYDPTNYGLIHPYRSDSIFQSAPSEQVYVPQIETLALHWDFMTVSTSDSGGNFVVSDVSSGSTEWAGKYSFIGNITKNKYDGYGHGFTTSSVNAVDKEFIYAAKKRLPDEVYSSDGVTIKTEITENFFEDDAVAEHYYAFEKSPYNAVSQQMISFFGSMKDFNSLVGNPAERYRFEYKELADIKRLFFERVENNPDPERFFEYFKWIDTSISYAISQLIPASARFAEEVKDIVESHILERNKYQEKFPLTSQQRSTEGVVKSFSEMSYNWQFGHAPLDGDDNKNCLWQKIRRKVSDSNVQALRDNIYKTSNAKLDRLYDIVTAQAYEGNADAVRRLSKPYKLNLELKQNIHGGTNYYVAKNRDYALEVVHPHGETTAAGVPKNVLVAGVGAGQGLIPNTVCKDEEDSVVNKEKFKFDGVDGRFSSDQLNAPVSDFVGYKNFTKGIATFPFNIMSQSTAVSTGYQSPVVTDFKNSAYITNVHSDTTDRTNTVPMQGPFTERHVGGHQSRHISVNKFDLALRDDETGNAPTNNLHNLYTRPEAWRLLLGENPNDVVVDGALGLTPPDYGVTAGTGIYVDIAKKRASFYREEKAKRPVNVKHIKHSESGSVVGNYNNSYENLMLQGRRENNLYYRDNPTITNYLPVQYTSSLPHTTHVMSLVGIDPISNGNVFGKQANNMQPDTLLITPEIAGTAANGSFSISGSTVNGIASSGSFRLNRQIVAATPSRFSFDVSGSHYAGTAASGSFQFARSTIAAVSASIQFTAKGRTIEQVESSGSFVVTASHVAGTNTHGSFIVKRPPYYLRNQGSFRVTSKDFLTDGHKITITQDPGGASEHIRNLEYDVDGLGVAGTSFSVSLASSITDTYTNLRNSIITETSYSTTTYSETSPTYGVGVWNSGKSVNNSLDGTFSAQHWPAQGGWSAAFWLYVSSSNSDEGLLFTEHAESGFDNDFVRKIFISDSNELVYRKFFDTSASPGYLEWSASLSGEMDRWSHVTISQDGVSSQSGASAVPTVAIRVNGSEITPLGTTPSVDIGNINAIPTGSQAYSFYSDGVDGAFTGGLDEFGLWNASLSQANDTTLFNGNLYIARTAVSPSLLKAWWRFGDDGNIVNRTSPFDADSSTTLTTNDLLEEQQSNQHATASENGTDLYLIDPSIYETAGYATFYVRTNNTGSEYSGTIVNSGDNYSNISNITQVLESSNTVVIQDTDSITLSGSVFELDSGGGITGDHSVAFTTNQNKTDFWNILSASIKTNTDFDTITITDNGNNATFALTSSVVGTARNGDITTEVGTSFTSLVATTGGTDATGATDGHFITIDGVRFELDVTGDGVSSGQDINCGVGVANSTFWNSLSASIKTNTDIGTIAIVDNSNGTATFSLTASTGGAANNTTITATGGSFSSLVGLAGGVTQSGSIDGQWVNLRPNGSQNFKFIVETSDGSQSDNTPANSYYVDSSVATNTLFWNNLSQSIKDRGFGVSYSAGSGQATFTVTTFETGSSGNHAGSSTSGASFSIVSNPFDFTGGSDIGDGNEGNKLTIGGETFEMDSNSIVVGSNHAVVSSGSLSTDQVFNNLTASIKTHTNFDIINVAGSGDTRTLSLTSSVVGTGENGKITIGTGGFGSLVATAGGTNTSGSQYSDTLVIGNHGSDVTITVDDGTNGSTLFANASLAKAAWWGDLSASIKANTNYDTITITDNGTTATFQLTSSVAEAAGDDTHSETGTTFFSLTDSTGGSDVGDSSDGSTIRIRDGVSDHYFVLDSDGTYSGDFNIPSSGSLTDNEVFNALTQSIKDNTLFDTIVMSPSSGNNRVLSLTSSVTGSDKNSALLGFSGDISLVSQTAGGTDETGVTDGHTITIDGVTFELDNNSSVTDTGTLKGIDCSDGTANTTFWNELSQSIIDNTVYDTITYGVSAGIATFELTSSTTGSVLNVGINKTGNSFSVIRGMEDATDLTPAVYSQNDVVLAVPTPTLRNGDRNKTIISSRFAAPGGVEIESNAYLDIYARELSVHNALPFRNLTVRGGKIRASGSTNIGGSGEANHIRVVDHLGKRRGLNTLLSLHSGQFGMDSTYGSIVEATYSTSGSFNKQHRNRSKRMEYSGSTIITGSLFDNAFVSTPIPRSEFQYSWINNTISGSNWEAGQRILGYQEQDGLVSSSAGIVEAIVFPSSSNII